jgi:hypothetical protein
VTDSEVWEGASGGECRPRPGTVTTVPIFRLSFVAMASAARRAYVGVRLLAIASIAACHTLDDPNTCPIAPVIVVSDASTGQPICDATLVATPEVDYVGPPDASQSLGSSDVDSSDDCVYYANLNYAVPYTIEISHAGYQSTTLTGIKVAADTCGMLPAAPRIVVALQPG